MNGVVVVGGALANASATPHLFVFSLKAVTVTVLYIVLIVVVLLLVISKPPQPHGASIALVRSAESASNGWRMAGGALGLAKGG